MPGESGTAVNELKSALGAKVLTSLPERLLYRYDAIAFGGVPRAVIIPETTTDVAIAIATCAEHGIPVVPRGAASGLSGGAVPSEDSVTITTNRMRRFSIDPATRRATVQPGVVNEDLQTTARLHGLYYPPDPASSRQSTIGGNIAENAGGPQCLKKGVTGDYVEELEFVTADGRVHRHDRSGPDLPGLLIGSEGTLAFVTEAVLRLEPLPRYTRTMLAVFDRLEQAGRAVALVTEEGLTPAKLELMDAASVRAVEMHAGLGLPQDADALLLSDCDGDDEARVAAEIEAVAAACREAGARTVTLATTDEEAAALWKARRNVSPALGNLRPHRMNEDIVVPRSKLPGVMREIQELGRPYPFPLAIFGHAGDGNLHPNIMFDRRTDDVAAVDHLAHEIARIAVRAGGVLSGEHGIGLTKRAFMREATPKATLEAYWRVKRALDPKGIMNPGKMLPDYDDETTLLPSRSGLGEREFDSTT